MKTDEPGSFKCRLLMLRKMAARQWIVAPGPRRALAWSGKQRDPGAGSAVEWGPHPVGLPQRPGCC